MPEGSGLHPDKVSLDRRRLHIETGQVPPVRDGFEEGFMAHAEVGPDKFLFQAGEKGFVEQGNLEEKILLEDFLLHPELVRVQADGGNPAALPVSPVVHLHGGFENMTAAHRNVTGEPRDAAPSLLRILAGTAGIIRPQMAPRLQDLLGE